MLIYTNMFLVLGPTAEGQACRIETERSPLTTEITQTKCDICSSAVATSRAGACRGTLLSGGSEKKNHRVNTLNFRATYPFITLG